MRALPRANAVDVKRAVSRRVEGADVRIRLRLVGEVPVDMTIGCSRHQQLDSMACPACRIAQLTVNRILEGLSVSQRDGDVERLAGTSTARAVCRTRTRNDEQRHERQRNEQGEGTQSQHFSVFHEGIAPFHISPFTDVSNPTDSHTIFPASLYYYTDNSKCKNIF